MFGLTYNPLFIAWSLEMHERYEIPPLLSITLSVIYLANANGL